MTLTIKAPDGAHFDYEELKTNHGDKSLGDAPILVWDKLDECVKYYTEEGVLSCLDGTSPRVSYQGIARRGRIKGKSDDEIAKEELDFRPGRRVVGVATPVSRAAKAAKAAAEKVDGDKIAAFLDRVAKGEITEDDFSALAGLTG